MIHNYIFSDGKLVGHDLDLDALRLVRADKGLVLWVDLDQPTDAEIKAVLEGVFSFHPLAIEDCVAPSSLPKVEDYEDYLFLVAHPVDFSQPEKFATTELNFFIGKEFIVTFHRSALRSIMTVMDRCTKGTGPIARGTDRLAHLILDAMVDNYAPITDRLRVKVEEIEETVLSPDMIDLTPLLLDARSEIARLREVIRPQREVITRLAHGESKVIRNVMLPYFRDLRDNLVRIEETAASFADQLLISFDLYLSKSGYQANEGIKVLTSLTAITLPAIIIGSWYGMNFENMPELHMPYGYACAAAITLIFTGLMIWWCRRRHWI
ncbi:magnesium/cobalt transporter CorA [Opitutaceae bacterium TAV4]|nr:magnesium/cobalt transporter CorA [Opitutaceae bacterium TAV4]RRJ99746.1 magnesium/cobalt transporter CorA [Opitutaceae bacterium TAV3]